MPRQGVDIPEPTPDLPAPLGRNLHQEGRYEVESSSTYQDQT